MARRNQQIILVSRPQGEATADNFRLVEQPLADAAATARCWCATTS